MGNQNLQNQINYLSSELSREKRTNGIFLEIIEAQRRKIDEMEKRIISLEREKHQLLQKMKEMNINNENT